MIKLSKLFLNSLSLVLISLSLSSCAGFSVADIKPFVQLPGSGECIETTVLSHKVGRMPKAECAKRVQRAIHLDSESWKMLKTTTLKNCQNAQCTQIKGALDNLFLAIDEALQQIPKVK